MERRLAAILAADVVSFSRLVGEDEAGTLESLKTLQVGFIEPLIAEHSGRIVKFMGDGLLVEFHSAVDAVACAIAWQHGLQARKDAGDFKFRIGVNLGDIVIDGDDILGDGVNVAARLEASGTPDHVVISDDVHRQIEGKLDASFHDNGSIELKNISRPVRVWSWPDALGHVIHSKQAGRTPGIYVDKFEARGPEAAELADAICDDLVTSFARQSGVRLITDRTAADYVVVGTVRGMQGRWRISASLIDQGNDQMVWSERYDETGDDVFDIQDRCVTRISGAVRIRLPSIIGSRLAKKSFEEMSVQDLLNHAMNRHFVPTLASWDDAVPALRLVLERDGDNWMAMAMLCFNLFTKVRIFDWRKLDEAGEKDARQLIERAHELKPDSEVVRLVHGAYFLYAKRDHRAARIETKESLRLNPNYYHSIDLMSQIELASGNVDVAKELASRAVDCDPGYPYLHLYQRSLGYVHVLAGNYASAVEMFQRADRAAPGLPQNLIGIVVSAQLNNDTDETRAAAESLLQLVPDFALDEYQPWPFCDTSSWKPYGEALLAAYADGLA